MSDRFIMFGDIVEKNGKTIRENNLEKTHKYPIGSLIELTDGERLYVMSYGRDCDGSPLYRLGIKEDSSEDPLPGWYGEHYKVVEP